VLKVEDEATSAERMFKLVVFYGECSVCCAWEKGKEMKGKRKGLIPWKVTIGSGGQTGIVVTGRCHGVKRQARLQPNPNSFTQMTTPQARHVTSPPTFIHSFTPLIFLRHHSR
jgi:hypothetical protein